MGGPGHAFSLWRLDLMPANQITDVPPCNCGVQGERGMGELPRAWRRVVGAGECCSCGVGWAVAGAVVAAFSAEAPAQSRAAQQTITALGAGPGRVSIAHS